MDITATEDGRVKGEEMNAKASEFPKRKIKDFVRGIVEETP